MFLLQHYAAILQVPVIARFNYTLVLFLRDRGDVHLFDGVDFFRHFQGV